MFPLFFVLMVTGMSIFISRLLTSEVTWFTQYIGGIVGLMLSGTALGYWNKKKRE
ncbi:MAG: hypothetical protein JRJ85_09630 [Deltaproteobacteria bacterium]|nr:hypothetical protein [Deltaproteobacteria bacterium]